MVLGPRHFADIVYSIVTYLTCVLDLVAVAANNISHMKFCNYLPNNDYGTAPVEQVAK